MKKFLVSLLLLIPLYGFAQKGLREVGVNLGLGSCFSGDYSGCIGFNYKKNLSDRIRFAASYCFLDYEYDHDYGYGYGSSYFLGGEVHYFLNDVRRLRPYAIGGIILGSYETEEYYETDTTSGTAGGIKLGVGLNCRIGYRWTVQFEIPLYIVAPYGCITPTFGLSYNF